MAAPTRLIFTTLFMAATLYPSPSRSAPESGCEPSTANEMIEVATTYLDAQSDPTGVKGLAAPFAPDVRRTEFPVPLVGISQPGAVSATSDVDMRVWFQYFAPKRGIDRYGNVRWVADVFNCQVMAFWLARFEIQGQLGTIAHIAERFKVSGGLIHEIEAFVSFVAQLKDGSCWPADGSGIDGPCTSDLENVPYEAPSGCEGKSGEGHQSSIIKTGSVYLTALVTGDVSKAKLADDARRTDFPFGFTPSRPGPVAGTGSAGVAERVEAEAPQRTGIRDVRWFVDTGTCQAVAIYLIDYLTVNPQAVDPRECTSRSEHLAQPIECTRHAATRLLILNNKIWEIESIEFAWANESGPEGSCWPRDPDPIRDESFRLLPCPFLP